MGVAYKRVLLKISGEALSGDRQSGIDVETVGRICDEIKDIVELGVQVAIVVGGGNFWRGRYGHQMERTTSDYMGMLATTINGLALQDTLEARRYIYKITNSNRNERDCRTIYKKKSNKTFRKRKSSNFCMRYR